MNRYRIIAWTAALLLGGCEFGGGSVESNATQVGTDDPRGTLHRSIPDPVSIAPKEENRSSGNAEEQNNSDASSIQEDHNATPGSKSDDTDAEKSVPGTGTGGENNVSAGMGAEENTTAESEEESNSSSTVEDPDRAAGILDEDRSDVNGGDSDSLEGGEDHTGTSDSDRSETSDNEGQKGTPDSDQNGTGGGENNGTTDNEQKNSGGSDKSGTIAGSDGNRSAVNRNDHGPLGGEEDRNGTGDRDKNSSTGGESAGHGISGNGQNPTDSNGDENVRGVGDGNSSIDRDDTQGEESAPKESDRNSTGNTEHNATPASDRNDTGGDEQNTAETSDENKTAADEENATASGGSDQNGSTESGDQNAAGGRGEDNVTLDTQENNTSAKDEQNSSTIPEGNETAADEGNATASGGSDQNGSRDTNATVLNSLTLTLAQNPLNKDHNTTLKVKGIYSDKSTEDLTEQVEWIVTPPDAVRISGRTLTALRDVNVTLQAKLGSKTSNPVTLSIYWEVNGHRLPPEPDPKINNATLLGVDINNNGVRDDVERWIYEKYKDKHPIHIDIAMQAARGYRLVLEHPERAKEIYPTVDSAAYCEGYFRVCVADSIKNKFSLSRISTNPIFIKKIFNIKDRWNAYELFDTLLSGDSYTIPRCKEALQLCDFNTSKYDKE